MCPSLLLFVYVLHVVNVMHVLFYLIRIVYCICFKERAFSCLLVHRLHPVCLSVLFVHFVVGICFMQP